MNPLRWNQRLLQAVFLVLAWSVFGPGQLQAAEAGQSRVAAQTQFSIADLASGKRDRLEFSDPRFKGWVRRDGEVYFESDVAHSGLLCAEYRVGVRVGAGAPGCSNVQWLSESVLATRRTQCNNASLRHVGGATYGALTSVFDRITCVERVISCSGAGCR